MRFTLIDRIAELVPGKTIVATKSVSLSEEYLHDHFPKFPVLPGVFMLEAATQACAWLIRASEEFAHSMVVLSEARNIKYANFLAPGQTLTVTAEILKQDERFTTLKIEGRSEEEVNVSGRLVLERFNLADEHPNLAERDETVRRALRRLFAILYQERVAGVA